MRNRYLEKWERSVKIRIKGSNINNYLKRVIKKKINIIELIPISYKEAHVILKYSEYKKLLDIKSIYEIEIISNLDSNVKGYYQRTQPKLFISKNARAFK